MRRVVLYPLVCALGLVTAVALLLASAAVGTIPSPETDEQCQYICEWSSD